MLKCFECESVVEIQHHHVVPRSKGGTKTVPLCQRCHFLAHGMDGKATEHSRLIKEGLEKAKERGWVPGGNLESIKDKSRESRIKKGNRTAEEYGLLIHTYRNMNMTYRDIAEIMNTNKVQAPRGGTWFSPRVYNIYKRWLKLHPEVEGV